MISLLLTAVAIAGNTINTIGVLVSIATEVRIWPPGERDWRYWLTWVNWYPATGAFLVVGALDWGSLNAIPIGGRIVGMVAAPVGLAITILAILELGVSETEGLEGELETDGLYQYSRNPQYVGDIVSVVGWVAITDSWLTLVIGATFVLYYLLLPLAEEPWLRQQYGSDYERYCRNVPRFVGLRTVRAALNTRG